MIIMNKNDKDKYIEFLEKRIAELSNNDLIQSDKDLSMLLKEQEKFLESKYSELDHFIFENRRLCNEINFLMQENEFNVYYIQYLSNSYWWKATYPFRMISRRIKKIRKKEESIQFIKDINLDNIPKAINDSVSFIIHTYNAGNEFEFQLKNISNQELIGDIQVIIIDHGSTDKTLELAKKYKIEIIDAKGGINWYKELLAIANGEYFVYLEQNKLVDSKYWLYQAILPIKEDNTLVTAFFKEDITFFKNSSFYLDFKNRINKLNGKDVLFFPKNRNSIQYIETALLKKTDILVKRRDSNKIYL